MLLNWSKTDKFKVTELFAVIVAFKGDNWVKFEDVESIVNFCMLEFPCISDVSVQETNHSNVFSWKVILNVWFMFLVIDESVKFEELSKYKEQEEIVEAVVDVTL